MSAKQCAMCGGGIDSGAFCDGCRQAWFKPAPAEAASKPSVPKAAPAVPVAARDVRGVLVDVAAGISAAGAPLAWGVVTAGRLLLAGLADAWHAASVAYRASKRRRGRSQVA